MKRNPTGTAERAAYLAVWLALGAMILVQGDGHFGAGSNRWLVSLFISATGLLLASVLPVPEQPAALDTWLYPLIVAGMGFIIYLVWPLL